MNKKIGKWSDRILKRESGYTKKEPGGRFNVALVWPGSYHTGMSALGYLSIYSLLNSERTVLAERFFWPDDFSGKTQAASGDLRSIESHRPLSAFDLVAGSLSLENDYWIFLKILELGGLLGSDRSPLVVAGGVGIWSNPWPLVPFLDLILAGEGECQWPRMVEIFRDPVFLDLKRAEKIEFLAKSVSGALAPGLWPEDVLNGLVSPRPVQPAGLAWPFSQDLTPPVSPILTPDTEFSQTRLVEISRGCPYGCRFCLAGFLYRPHRYWEPDKILAALGSVEKSGEKVGLISPAVADHPGLYELLDCLNQDGRKVTVSSLRLTAVTEDLAKKLASGQLKGVAVAPEGGSSTLRNIINKNLSEAEILASSRLLALSGLSRLKLYFMIGLPGETDQDLKDLVELCRLIKLATTLPKGRGPYLTISLANFTPKPHTPFEDEPLLTEAEFRRRAELVGKKLGSLGGFNLNLDSPKWTLVQGLLARGGAESHKLVVALAQSGGKSSQALKSIGYSPMHKIHRSWEGDRPWRVIAPSGGIKYLEDEKKKVLNSELGSICPPKGGCGRCQACGTG